VLRDSGFAAVRAEGSRRFYTVEPAPLREVDAWLDRFRRFWDQRLDALGTELARGQRARRTRDGGTPTRPAGFSTDPGRTDPGRTDPTPERT
jgi:hypothetical protein